MNPVKTSVSDIYQHMFSDLDWAIKVNYLLSRMTVVELRYGLPKALKARLLLTRASVTKDAKMYEQAYNLAKDVIDNGPLSWLKILLLSGI